MIEAIISWQNVGTIILNTSSIILVLYYGSSFFVNLSFLILNINPSILCFSQFINSFSKSNFNLLLLLNVDIINLNFSIFSDISISFSVNSFLKFNICFSNLFKKGGSNFKFCNLILSTITIT